MKNVYVFHLWHTQTIELVTEDLQGKNAFMRTRLKGPLVCKVVLLKPDLLLKHEGIFVLLLLIWVICLCVWMFLFPNSRKTLWWKCVLSAALWVQRWFAHLEALANCWAPQFYVETAEAVLYISPKCVVWLSLGITTTFLGVRKWSWHGFKYLALSLRAWLETFCSVIKNISQHLVMNAFFLLWPGTHEGTVVSSIAVTPPPHHLQVRTPHVWT